MRSGKNSTLLVVGPLPNERLNCQWGGTTILMKDFCEYLSEKGFEYQFVQTNKYVHPRTLQLRPLANKIYFLFHFCMSLPACETVMFNFSDHGTVYLFPALSRLAHLMGKRVVLRKFGGSFDIYLKTVQEKKQSRVISALKGTDLILFETKAGIAHLQKLIGDTANIHWFPNVRKAAPHRKDPTQFSHKLVFMSHISDEKGVGILLEAFRLLPAGYALDFYGAIKEKSYEKFDWEAHHVCYKGEISSEEVTRKLTEYDILLLPSRYREGYPGIIIEALSVGMPVIASRAGGIPEMIKDGFDGRLLECTEAEEIVSAVSSINKDNYATYCEHAYESFCKRFESERTNEHVFSLISSVGLC